MKNKFTLFLILLVMVLPLFSREGRVLEGILKPTMIEIYKNSLYVVDMDKIKVFDLASLKLVNTFGKKGGGPGEYQVHLQIPLRIKGDKDYLFVESINKFLYYSHEGKYLKEVRKPVFANIIRPIGKNFIGRRLVQPRDGSMWTSNAQIYNDKFELIKELYIHKFLRQGSLTNYSLDLAGDFLLFEVYDNKIFIEESGKGPVIEVFDFSGRKLYEIKIPDTRIPITAGVQDQLIEDFKNDTTIKRIMSNGNMSWNTFRKTITFKFPDYFPSVRTMDIDDNKIYIKTFEKNGNSTKYIIMNLKGDLLKTAFVPNTIKTEIMSAMMGVKREKISNNKLYFILENEDEEWELHITEIKDQ